jgi:hypothetical protein
MPRWLLAMRRAAGPTPRSRLKKRLGAVMEAALLLAAANTACIAIGSEYDWHLGPLHLVAHGVFKRLLLLNAVFVALILLRRARATEPQPIEPPNRWRAPLIVAVVLCVYTLSFTVNFDHNEWTHRFNTAARPTLPSLARYFYEPQLDGFYRPLGFLSLWIDRQLFGDALSWYHLQSLLLHCLNSLLVMALAGSLGYGVRIGTVAALVFATVPASFEPVLWPGARFDVLSAFFSLIALLLFLRYAHSGRPRAAPLWAGLAFLLALLAKEAAYCVPLLLLALRLARRLEIVSPAERSRWRRVIVEALAIAAVLLAVRLCVYGGLAGYPAVKNEPVQFKLTPRTVTSLLTKAPGIVPFAVNSAGGMPPWSRAVVVAYALLLVCLATAYRPSPQDPRRRLFLFFLVAALPVLNIVGWIGPSLQQGRYLYAPAIWWSFLIASVLVTSARRRLLIPAWIAVTGLAAFFNVYAQAQGLERIRQAVRQIQVDSERSPACRSVALVGIEEHQDGVYFFSHELLTRTRAALPSVRVDAADRPQPDACLTYTYSSGALRKRLF